MGQRPSDPRAQALAGYLRQRAAAFSLAADSNDEQHIASAGMALLDAAELAESLPATDSRLETLAHAGRFKRTPTGELTFVETGSLRAVVQRPLAGSPTTGAAVLDLLVASCWDD